MPTVIDSFVVELGLDSSKMSQDQRDALEKMRQFEQEAISTGKRTEGAGQSALAGLGAIKKSTLGLIGAFLGGMGVTEFVNHITKLDAATMRVAKTMDLSTRDLAAWQSAAKQTGGSAEGITGTLQGLSSEINNFALTGRTSLLGPLTNIGVSLNKANGEWKNSAELFLDIADAVNGMDPARARALLSMLGMDQDAVNMAIRGRRAIEDMIDAGRKANNVTGEGAAQAEKYQASMKLLQETSASFGRTFVNLVTPAIAGAMDKLRELFQLWQIKPGTPEATKLDVETRPVLVQKFGSPARVLEWLRDHSFDEKSRARLQKIIDDTYGSSKKDEGIEKGRAREAAAIPGGGSGSSSMEAYGNAIAAVESSGGNYRAVGPVVQKGRYAGQRAYGKYQVMEGNIGEWTKAASGRSLTPQEFLNQPDAQEAVFKKYFGDLVAKFGPQDAASIWFTGRRLSAGGAGASDGYNSGARYVEKFNAALAAQLPPVNTAASAAGNVNNSTVREGDTNRTTNQTHITTMNVNVPTARDAAATAASVHDTLRSQSSIATWDAGQE